METHKKVCPLCRIVTKEHAAQLSLKGLPAASRRVLLCDIGPQQGRMALRFTFETHFATIPCHFLTHLQQHLCPLDWELRLKLCDSIQSLLLSTFGEVYREVNAP